MKTMLLLNVNPPSLKENGLLQLSVTKTIPESIDAVSTLYRFGRDCYEYWNLSQVVIYQFHIVNKW